MKRIAIPILAIFLSMIMAPFVLAQEETPTPSPTPLSPADPSNPVDQDTEIPLVHIVENGETLSSIAQQYGTTIELLQQLNSIEDPSLLYVGQEILIPGGGGELMAVVHVTQVGDTMLRLAAVYSTTVESVAAGNRLVKIENLSAGQPLKIMSRTGSAEPMDLTGLAYIVQPGDTLLTVAVEHGLSPVEIIAANHLPYPAHLLPNQILSLPSNDPYQPLPGNWQQIRMSTVPIVQGESAAIYVESRSGSQPSGSFAGQELHFTPYTDGFLALVGLDAFTEPGQYKLQLLDDADQDWPAFNQQVQVISGNYGTQLITVPEQLNSLLDPSVRAGDETIMAPAFEQISQSPLWSSAFQLPVIDVPISAGYGAARSYNDGPIEIFHTGVDFAGAIGTPINAPAAGTVIFSDTLPLHGNTLLVDHGLGVVTGYYHLSKIHTSPGETVVTGQSLAEGGSTGLSSGPHLHWDLRIHNVPVNGLQWIEQDLLGVLLGPQINETAVEEGS